MGNTPYGGSNPGFINNVSWPRDDDDGAGILGLELDGCPALHAPSYLRSLNFIG